MFPDQRVHKIAFIAFILQQSRLFTPGYGHGRLMEPPARNTLWRFGFIKAPANYNDNELFCGGIGVSLTTILPNSLKSLSDRVFDTY